MILADTNIIIGFWRKPDEDAARVFGTEDVAICGVVKAELLHGARSLEDCGRILRALSDFPYVDMREADWDSLGHHLWQFRSRGVAVPFQDAIIATLALSNKASVWTHDRHFALMKSVLPALQLYEM